MSALHTKLFRELKRLVGQGITIALVVACGVSTYVALQGCYASLLRSRDAYYTAERFPDLFVHLEHAPDALRGRLAVLPGVASVETRLVESIRVPLRVGEEPAVGSVVSLPSMRAPVLGGVRLRSGRWPSPGRGDEAVILESFAQARGLGPGDTIPVILGGIRREIRAVGVGLSPEYVFATGGGVLVQQDDRFVILWMDQIGVAPLLRKEGAFNDALFRLEPGQDRRAVIAAIDRLLVPHGGLGAHGRDLQPSNRMLDAELGQLRSSSVAVPLVFLAVAAFLVNVVLSRLIALQRPQIATLRALGYTRIEVGAHYLSLALWIVGLGGVLGVLGGGVLGDQFIELYRPYFRFPELSFSLAPEIPIKALLFGAFAASFGAFWAVRSAVALPPAEAMRPEAPTNYRVSPLEMLGLGRWLGASGNMVFRELWRRPLRTALSILGIASAVAVSMTARFSLDAVDALRDLEWVLSHREDLQVTFRRPLPAPVEGELRQLPGVLSVELRRTVPVRIHAGHRSREIGLVGHPTRAVLSRVMAWPPRQVQVEGEGLIVPRALADALLVREGSTVDIEVLWGERRRFSLLVAEVSEETVGQRAHLPLGTLWRRLGEESSFTEAALLIDPASEANLLAKLADLPAVASVQRPKAMLEAFDRQTGGSMGTTTALLSFFGAVLAIGIVYNNARIILSMRGRDLATLRVLGFTRGEISALLLGELGVQVGLALPVGVALGAWMLKGLVESSATEVFRMPVILSAKTILHAVMVTVLAAAASAFLVRRKLDHLDLLETLKSRDT